MTTPQTTTPGAPAPGSHDLATPVDDRWTRYDPTSQAMAGMLATAAGLPTPQVAVVPWLGYREPGRTIGDGGLAEVHQTFRRTTTPVIYLAEPALTDLQPAVVWHLLARELGHIARHGRLHAVLNEVAALAVWPVTVAVAAGAWHAGARGVLLIGLAAAALGVTKLLGRVLDLLQAVQADDYSVRLAPLTSDQIDQLWNYLASHLESGLTAWYRRRRQHRQHQRLHTTDTSPAIAAPSNEGDPR